MNSTLSPPPPGAASTMNNNSEWTLAEKIRLLELYMDKDLLWDQRAEMLQKEFAKRRPLDFFCVQNLRNELHKIFNKPNPEHHVYGMPVHPRGREAAELWLKCFRKEYTEQYERKKQMFAVTLRHQMVLIRRYQQDKLTADEIDAIVTEAREKDAKRPDREIYEAKLKEMMDKHHKDDLKNIRSYGDYCNFMRGERVPTPPPEPPKIEQPQIKAEQPQVVSTVLGASPARSFGSPEPVLKGPKSPSTTSPIISPSSPVLTLKPTRKSVTPVSSSPVVAKKKSVKTQAATDARKKKAEEKRLQEQREKSEEKKGTNKEKQQLRQTYSVIEPKTAWATTTETPARPRKRKRGELDFLSPELISSEEICGPPARNLRRSSQQLSPAPASTQSATSS